VIDLAQRVRAGDAKCLHEVPHVEPIGAAGLSALLLRQPDFFFEDGGQRLEGGELVGTVSRNKVRVSAHATTRHSYCTSGSPSSFTPWVCLIA